MTTINVLLPRKKELLLSSGSQNWQDSSSFTGVRPKHIGERAKGQAGKSEEMAL
jgi:hypothetical protein